MDTLRREQAIEPHRGGGGGNEGSVFLMMTTAVSLKQKVFVMRVVQGRSESLTFLCTVCRAGSSSSSMWKSGGLVEDSLMGLGRAMILPSSPNQRFP